jgi:hypothetical protein
LPAESISIEGKWSEGSFGVGKPIQYSITISIEGKWSEGSFGVGKPIQYSITISGKGITSN